ncbi:hypothetical protein [Caulobacter segnis]
MTDFLPERLEDLCGSRDEPTVGATAALTTEQHLKRFYIELQAWVDGGCCAHPVFNTERRVCSSAKRWHAHNRLRLGSEWALWDEIAAQFEGAGLSSAPFAKGDFSEDFNGLYRNPARLAWIRAHATPDGAERVHEQVPQPIRDASNDGL